MSIKLRRILLIFFLYSCCITVIFNTSLKAISLEDLNEIQITSEPNGVTESPSITISQHNVHVVWHKRDIVNSTVYYKNSFDNGKNWNDKVELSLNTTSAYDPKIAVNNDIIHVVWTDYRDNQSEIYYTQSIDNGQNWDSPKRLTYHNSSIENTIYNLNIVTDENNVYLAWKDYGLATSEIYFKRSQNNGVSWKEDQRLTVDYTPSYYPSLAYDSDNLYISYQDGGLVTNICLLTSDSKGKTWSEKVYITDLESASKKPQIAISNNVIYLIWQDDMSGNQEIYFKKSIDQGKSWLDTKQITDNAEDSINPRIYTYNEEIIVLWSEFINNSFWISYSTSIDSGESWSKADYLITEADCYDVSIVGEKHNVHIIYQRYDNKGWANIWYLGKQSQSMISITSLTVSKTTISETGSITILVEGEDSNFNKSDLICFIDYKKGSGEWKSLDVSLINDHWEAVLLVNEISENVDYNIRAKLINPNNIESDWTINSDIKVVVDDTPGFEFSLIIIILFTLIISIRLNKKKRK